MSLSRRILFSLMFALLAVFSFHSAKAIAAKPASGSGQATLNAAPEKEDDEKGEKEDEDEDDDDKGEKKVQP